MPRKKVKTRVQHLVDAHGRLQQAKQSLHAIDLRATTGTLREEVREARDAVEDGLAACEVAIKTDASTLGLVVDLNLHDHPPAPPT